MTAVCWFELADFEKFGFILICILGLILVIVGIILAFRKAPWRSFGSIKDGERRLVVPGPLAFILLGLALFGAAFWWLLTEFPKDSFIFKQKKWTLSQIKERLERDSNLRIALKGDAGLFEIDKKISGRCATDIVMSICNYYDNLNCNNEKPGVIEIDVAQ